MKKLESLKSSKFEDFKSNEIQNMYKIVGGKSSCIGTRSDCINRATSDGTHTDGAGNGIDFSWGDC